MCIPLQLPPPRRPPSVRIFSFLVAHLTVHCLRSLFTWPCFPFTIINLIGHYCFFLTICYAFPLLRDAALETYCMHMFPPARGRRYK